MWDGLQRSKIWFYLVIRNKLMFLGEICQLTSFFLNLKCYRCLNTVNVNPLFNYQRPVANCLAYSSQSQRILRNNEVKSKKMESNAEEVVIKTADLSKKERLKKAVKEYGSTVIIFHVGISLISLGTCYILVSM